MHEAGSPGMRLHLGGAVPVKQLGLDGDRIGVGLRDVSSDLD